MNIRKGRSALLVWAGQGIGVMGAQYGNRLELAQTCFEFIRRRGCPDGITRSLGFGLSSSLFAPPHRRAASDDLGG